MMASWLFGGMHTASANVPTYFDIRLENDTLWLPNSGDSDYGTLNGTVVLCLSKPLPVKDFKLHIRGSHYINWDCTDIDGQHRRVPWRESIFYHQIWNFKKGSKNGRHVLQAGNHEFPFSVSLNNRLPTSIEGMDDCYIRYNLTASLDCPWGEINESRSMGVCRVQDIFSFIEPQSIEGFWDEKITYTIAVPGHAFPLGGSIKVDMRYIPLLKGLFAETMKIQLIETHSIYPRSGFQGRMQRTRESIVVEDVAKFKEFEDNFDLENDDQWRRISHSIVIPKFLGKCRPTSRSSILEVIHSLKLSIRLRNPNGKYSEISAVFHLNLCPTSGLGIDQSCQSNIFVRIQPPPAYTDYIRDQPYLDSVSPSVSRASSSSDLSCTYDTLGEYPSWPASLEDISRVPCYEEAVLSGTPGSEYSPLYSV